MAGFRGRIGWPAGAALVAALAALVLASVPEERLHNFHAVDPGRLYRSGQLDADTLREILARYGIRTIVNLRGAAPHRDWYRDEAEVAEALGVRLVDLGMSSRRIPHREELVRLLETLGTAERPVLVHCFGGADRAGLASALYVLEYMQGSREDALDMLRPGYLHVPWLKPAMRYFVERYQGGDWARTDYDPCRSAYRYYDTERYCR